MTSIDIYNYATEDRIRNFRPTWLYIKRHTKTGLLYLGKTVKENINSYTGSGARWVRHIRKHGKDLTENVWCCYFTEPEELIKTAILLSEIMDVVEDPAWANLMPENGLDGGNVGLKRTPESNLKLSIAIKGKKKPPRTKEHAMKIGLSQRGSKKPGSGPKVGQRKKKEVIKIKKGRRRTLYFL